VRNALVLLPVFSLGLSGCLFDSGSSDSSACGDGRQTLHASDGRTLCVGLETVAEAPFSEGFYTARVTHRVRIADSDGTPIDIGNDPVITAVGHEPLMHMTSGHEHGTPQAHEPEDSSDPTQGLYDLVAYYSMPSGPMMGEWDYQVQLTDAGGGTLTAHFQPQVKAVPAPDVFSARASNGQDQTKNMDGLVIDRPYTVWLHAVRPTADGHRFTVFVSTQDMAMMSMNGMTMMHMRFPEVAVGTALHDENDSEFTLDTVSVRASVDGGTTWVDLTHEGQGRYSGTLSGLTEGERAEVQVALTVNGLTMAAASGASLTLSFVAP